jgi:hypothetical protein
MERCAMCGSTARQDEGDPCVVQPGRVWPVCSLDCALELVRVGRALDVLTATGEHIERGVYPLVAYIGETYQGLTDA